MSYSKKSCNFAEKISNMAANNLRRYIWLIDVVYSAGRNGISFEDIARKWENSSLFENDEYNKRTFHRHRDDILEIFGLEIKCNRGTRNYYFDEDDDISNPSISRTWLLESLSVNNVITESSALHDRILLERIPSVQNCLVPLLQAMKNSQKCNFTYSPFWLDFDLEYVGFEPYTLKMFHRRWYVLGKRDGKPLKTYALDRMSNVSLLPDTRYSIPEDFDSEEYYRNMFGVYFDEETKIENVKLKVDAHRAKYLRSLPLHHTQKETETNADYSIFTLRLGLTYDFFSELLSYGPGIEVLEPLSFRKEFKDSLREMLKKY